MQAQNVRKKCRKNAKFVQTTKKEFEKMMMMKVNKMAASSPSIDSTQPIFILCKSSPHTFTHSVFFPTTTENFVSVQDLRPFEPLEPLTASRRPYSRLQPSTRMSQLHDNSRSSIYVSTYSQSIYRFAVDLWSCRQSD